MCMFVEQVPRWASCKAQQEHTQSSYMGLLWEASCNNGMFHGTQLNQYTLDCVNLIGNYETM